MTPFAPWQNFYVIVGSSAGALIGLQFVVLSLIASRVAGAGDPAAGRVFATPTIVHFATVLGLSGLLSAPWNGIRTASVIWGLTGAAGIVYAILVTRRLRSQTAYKPEFEDWLCHAHLPFIAYALLAGSALAARSHTYEALFCTAGASLLLLFIGIHNAWDAVTYHVFTRAKDHAGKQHIRTPSNE
ncbi:MAG: hypothetical protein JO307_24965 [Bryobacterales bacterium]|nr:hypothetical protein [Bryobacterales bacterium]MBV9401476.1 hypothetical protein [Bryobacterales bacterium]